MIYIIVAENYKLTINNILLYEKNKLPYIFQNGITFYNAYKIFNTIFVLYEIVGHWKSLAHDINLKYSVRKIPG